MKAGKASGEDDIRPKMLKTVNNFDVYWLTCVCQVAWNWRGTEAMADQRVNTYLQKRRQEEMH